MPENSNKPPSSEDLIRQARESLEARQPEEDSSESSREDSLGGGPGTEPIEPAVLPQETIADRALRGGRDTQRTKPPVSTSAPPGVPWYQRGWVRVLGVMVAVVLGVLNSDAFEPTPELGEVDVGDCFNLPELVDAVGPMEIQGLELVSCDEVHDYESFAVVDYPSETQGAYPGDEVLASLGAAECATSFAGYVDTNWFDSGYDVSPIYPNPAGWEADDRTIQCSLSRLDGQKMEGTARGSGSIVPEGYVSLFRLEEGDCFDDTGWFAFGLPTSCRLPHDNEVYAVFTSPDEPGAAYSSVEEVSFRVAQRCASAFAWRVDPEPAAPLDYAAFAFPLPHTWQLGHRSSVCALWAEDLTKLSGSQLLAHTRFDALMGVEFEDRSPIVSFADFTSMDGLDLVGSAHQSNRLLSLTTFAEHAERGVRFQDERPQRGAAWLSEKVSVENGFETAFVFQSEMYSWFTIGDGFAFVIQTNSPTTVGEDIGYAGIPNSVAVEFDTFRQSWLSDPLTSFPDAPDLLANHVSIHTRGTQPNDTHGRASLGLANLDPIRMSDRAAHVALIRYVPGEMTVFVDQFDTPVLRIDIDLADTLRLDDGSAYVGFTASSGPRITGHKILAWELFSSAS